MNSFTTSQHQQWYRPTWHLRRASQKLKMRNSESSFWLTRLSPNRSRILINHQQSVRSPPGPEGPSRIIGFEKFKTELKYYVRWKRSFVTGDQLYIVTLHRIFKLREAHGQGRFFRIPRNFQPDERELYIIMWKDSWVRDVDIFVYGSLLHEFWIQFYERTPRQVLLHVECLPLTLSI